MNNGVLWLILTEESHKKLLEAIKPLYTTIFGHHVTLFYGIPLQPQHRVLLGTKHIVSVKENAYNEKIQAVTVDLKALPCQNINPHITISAMPNTPPVESNKMLQGPHEAMQVVGLDLEGIVQFKEFTGK